MLDAGQYLTTTGNLQLVPALPSDSDRRPSTPDTSQVEKAHDTIRIFVYLTGVSQSATIRAYADYLSGLLHGQISYFVETSDWNFSNIRVTAASQDLLLFGEPEQSRLQRLLLGPAGKRIVKNATTTILMANHPRWPIRKILMVLRVEALEELAIDWAGRLTFLSGAKLTILPLVPSQPLIYGSGSYLQVGIESLMTPTTPSGEQLRKFLSQLRQWQVNGTVRVRQGDPLWQICWEVNEGNYDLIIMGAEPHSRWRRWLFGELIGPLISRVNTPLLIAGASPPRKVRTKHVDGEGSS